MEKNINDSSSSSPAAARKSQAETTSRNVNDDGDDDGGGGGGDIIVEGDDVWVEVSVEMAGQSAMTRGGGGGGGGGGAEDESAIVSLEQILREGIVADGTLRSRLTLGRRWHWRISIDVRTFTFPYISPPSFVFFFF